MTSREVYNRILWDPRIDQSHICVGYLDRFRGVVEIPFLDQKLTRDVPWHRVVHYRYQERVVWNRDGVDHLDSLALNPRFSPAGCFRWNGESWQAVSDDCQGLAAREIRLLSLNVLFDLYDDRVPSTESRFSSLVERLRGADADLIALQEVTPKLCALLAGEPWVRQTYFLSSSPSGEGLSPYGPLVLSRLPGNMEHLELVSGKTVVKALFHFEGEPVQLFVVHLYSDRAEDAALRRLEQLEELSSHFLEEGSVWLVGDFNLRGRLDMDGFQDAWLRQESVRNGLTFDPALNSLARLTSRRARSGRLDRLMYRGSWHCTGMEVLADTGVVSDHHALFCEMSPPVSEKPVHRSALVVMPPKECWPAIQQIRRRHDKSFHRWMPHMNLLYGFVPEQGFERACRLLRSRLAGISPFLVRLREYERFQHKKSTTIWLRPDCRPPGALRELQSLCQSLFPQCSEQSTRGEQGFIPHLTVASVRGREAEPELPALDLEFEVDQLHLISRRDDQPFEVRESVRLGGERFQFEYPLSTAARTALEALKSVVKLPLYPTGSTALELDLPWSDLDCVCLGHVPVGKVFERLPGARMVEGRVVLLTFLFDGVQVDLQYAQLPPDTPLITLGEMTDAQRRQLSDPCLLALHSLEEVRALQSRVNIQAFRPFLRQVRLWTRRRCLDDPTLGFPGGLAWALLALRGWKEGLDTEAQWIRFLDIVGDWDWPSPLANTTEALASYQPRDNRPFPVLSLTAPFVNVASQVTALTAEVILREIRETQELILRGQWSALTESLQAREEVVIEFDGMSDENWGSFKHNALGFLLKAESEVPFFRPLSLEREAERALLRLDCSWGIPQRAVAWLRDVVDGNNKKTST